MKEINQGLRRHLLLTAPIRKQLMSSIKDAPDSIAYDWLYGDYWTVSDGSGNDYIFRAN